MKITRSLRSLLLHGTVRNSAIVFTGTMTANVASYIYHLLMGRMLGPSGYGELSSLLSILYIFTVPLMVGQTVIVKLVSALKATGKLGQSKTLFIKITKLVILFCLVCLPVIAYVSPWVMQYLHLSSPMLFTLVYVLFVFTLLGFVASSMLQGYQKFIPYSTLAALAIVVKLIISAPSVKFGVTGVLWAAIIAAIVVYGLYFFPLRFLFAPPSLKTQISKMAALLFAFPTFLTILGITSLYSTDIILVRHYFSPSQAGVYSALAILGKIIFYASSAISLALFPVVSEKTTKGESVRTLVWSAIGGVVGITVLLLVLYFAFPAIIVGMLFGTSYVHASGMLGVFGVFLGLFSLGYILANMSLAMGKTQVWIFPVVGALLQIAGISLFHTRLIDVIYVNIAVCAVYVAGSFLYVVKKIA